MDAEAERDPGGLLLIQFAKSPVPGQVKTRMFPTLSAIESCALHEELVLWTCSQLNAVGAVELWVSGGLEHPLFATCKRHGVSAVRQQIGDNLGGRMYNALADGLSRYQQVILVGSDCPFIDAEYLQMARRALDSHSVVLGPADDGGYVLIGAREHSPAVFTGVEWGQSSVFAQTVELLMRQNIDWISLESLPDIDRPEDLPKWNALKNTKALSR
jgi:rSAM/selenodomain-associated transferase 1